MQGIPQNKREEKKRVGCKEKRTKPKQTKKKPTSTHTHTQNLQKQVA